MKANLNKSRMIKACLMQIMLIQMPIIQGHSMLNREIILEDEDMLVLNLVILVEIILLEEEIFFSLQGCLMAITEVDME